MVEPVRRDRVITSFEMLEDIEATKPREMTAK